VQLTSKDASKRTKNDDARPDDERIGRSVKLMVIPAYAVAGLAVVVLILVAVFIGSTGRSR
jgi:hypothetical protein